MTAQIAHTFISDHPEFRLPGYRLYGIIRGAPQASNYGWGDGPFTWHANPYERDAHGRPVDLPSSTTANRAGYVPILRLLGDGRLLLQAFTYDDHAWQSRRVDEVLEGDFWAVFKREFKAPRVYVPFRDGRIVAAPAAWLVEVRDAETVTSVFVEGFVA